MQNLSTLLQLQDQYYTESESQKEIQKHQLSITCKAEQMDTLAYTMEQY